MGVYLFQDEWVTVTESTVECAGATYAAATLSGVRIAEIRETAGAKILGWTCLLVVCNFAVCAALESFRMPLLAFLALAGVSLGWAYIWAPPTFYVFLNISGNEMALVRYAKKDAALATIDGIRAAIAASRGLAQPAERP